MSVLGNIDVRRGGWLHRVVQYHKGKFIRELRKLAPIQIKAKIIPAPKGYKDSDKWNLESVLHLIVLIRTSQAAAPVYRALRRSLMPSRRIMMSMADSFKHFPSLSNVHFIIIHSYTHADSRPPHFAQK
ncbi:unnamed protein product [Arctia plantaginis]|uniref:Uncharacterized protein n=1 Tax=Arctia plantaginis TaxID=874455 RepID=A0A8S0ZKC5_ARCPL|nr:unnamed protein product [Arctia plantaginis]